MEVGFYGSIYIRLQVIRMLMRLCCGLSVESNNKMYTTLHATTFFWANSQLQVHILCPTFPLCIIELDHTLSSISYSHCFPVMFWEQCVFFRALGSLHLHPPAMLEF